MSGDVDAVMAALRIVLHEAETRTYDTWWKTHVVNRWIDQLPGGWRGKWRNLRLRADSGFEATRTNLITHVRSTLAYLETNRDVIAAQSSWRPFGRVAPRVAAKADEVAVKEKPAAGHVHVETTTNPKWLN